MATAEVMRVLDASPAEAGRILSDFRSCGLVRDDNETVAFVRPQDEDLARQLALFGAAEDASK
jgi:DNA-binding IclR family transcriptional regulator